MGGLLTFVVLVLIGIVLLPIIALIQIGGLKAQIANLEQELEALRAKLQDRSRRSEMSDLAQSIETKRTEPNPEPQQQTPPEPSPEPEPEPAVAEEPMTATPLLTPEQASIFDVKPQDKDAAEELAARVWAWVAQNWISIAAAGSLALAGIFLVRYGMEQGLITPLARIAFAALLGAALIIAGEYLRRRGHLAGEIIPAALAGAGLVVLYGTVIASEVLYGFVPKPMALILLVLVSLIALTLGGRHAIFLSAFGLIGVSSAPWIIQGEAGSVFFLPAYYLAIAATGLVLAWLRAWPAIAPLALTLSLFMGGLPIAATSDLPTLPMIYFLLLGCLSGFAAARLPNALDQLIPFAPPTHPNGWASLVSVLLLAGSTIALILQAATEDLIVLAIGAILVPAGIRQIFQVEQSKLKDLSAIFFMAMTGLITLYSLSDSIDWITIVGLFIALVSFMVYAIGQSQSEHGIYWVLASVLLIAAPFGIWELGTEPEQALSLAGWTGACMAAACLATWGAVRTGQKLGNLSAAGLYAICAGGLIILALTIPLREAALTLALSAALVLAALIQRRFDLPFINAALSIGGLGLLGRILVFPGFAWAWSESWWLVLLVYVAAMAAFAAILLLYRGKDNELVLQTTVSALILLIPSLFCLFLFRLQSGDNVWEGANHWSASIAATALILSAVLRSRMPQPESIARLISFGSIAITGIMGALGLVLGTLVYSPAINGEQIVLGPIVLNSLLACYLLPALTLLTLSRRDDDVRKLFFFVGSALVLVWMFSALRHFWHGPSMQFGSIHPAEQTSYTILMAMLGAALLYASHAFSRTRHPAVRRAALIALGVTVAKAVFIDAAGLEGLARVISFLVLGLTLAALAWIDQKMSGQLNLNAESEKTFD
jgi:uncharacterized membrane protein